MRSKSMSLVFAVAAAVGIFAFNPGTAAAKNPQGGSIALGNSANTLRQFGFNNRGSRWTREPHRPYWQRPSRFDGPIRGL